MKSLLNSALSLTLVVVSASFATSAELTIAIVNNGHMINMQKVAEAYTAETARRIELGVAGRRRSSGAGNL